jgi:hypothetical protein
MGSYLDDGTGRLTYVESGQGGVCFTSSDGEKADVEEHWFTCECSSPEHSFRVAYFKSDDPADRELYVSVFLQEFSLPKRVWEAIKYVIGIKSRYGHWEEVILRRDDVSRLCGLLEKSMAEGKKVPPSRKNRVKP